MNTDEAVEKFRHLLWCRKSRWYRRKLNLDVNGVRLHSGMRGVWSDEFFRDKTGEVCYSPQSGWLFVFDEPSIQGDTQIYTEWFTVYNPRTRVRVFKYLTLDSDGRKRNEQ